MNSMLMSIGSEAKLKIAQSDFSQNLKFSRARSAGNSPALVCLDGNIA
jgi:hypothetical protein